MFLLFYCWFSENVMVHAAFLFLAFELFLEGLGMCCVGLEFVLVRRLFR